MSGPALRIIGTVRTPYATPEHTPVQAALNLEAEGIIEIAPAYRDALDGLEGFSHLWLLTWLGPAEGDAPEPSLRQVPFLLQAEGTEYGIFATRGPRRPSPLGLSLVRLLGVDGTTLRFAGVDLVDGTALVDIKPYFDDVDRPVGEVRCGWFDALDLEHGSTPASLQGREGREGREPPGG